jgi:UDP-glucuronate decarboxylase
LVGSTGKVESRDPRNCYDMGGRAAATLFSDCLHQHGIRVMVARLFNTYGPCMHPNDGRVVTTCMVEGLRDEPAICFAVSELSLMDSPDHVIGPVNLGDPIEFTMHGLARYVVDLIGSRSEIVFEPLSSYDPRQDQPASTLPQETLGWAPAARLAVGLGRTAAYLREELVREVARAAPGTAAEATD